MKLSKLFFASLSFVSLLSLNIAPVFAGQWDGEPVVNEFTFNAYSGKTYLKTATVKTGELTTDYGHTEVEIKYNAGMCELGYLQTTFDVELGDGYSNYSYSTVVNPYELASNTAYIQIDGRIDPKQIFVTASTDCIREFDEKSIEFDSTSSCDSHWLDSDCWGW